MVRLSGFLDQDDERRRRPPSNYTQRHGDNNRGMNNVRQIHNSILPVTNNDIGDVISGRMQYADVTREAQKLPTSTRARGKNVNVNSNNTQQTKQNRNQERLRPKLLKAIPSFIKEESIEMEPLIPVSQSSTIRNNSRKDKRSRIDTATKLRDDVHFINHRGQEWGNSTPRQYKNLHIDDEEDDIVCCDDCFRHEGTKNLCTISIWAALVFFIMNRFFVHMSIYLHRGEANKVIIVGENFTSSG